MSNVLISQTGFGHSASLLCAICLVVLWAIKARISPHNHCLEKDSYEQPLLQSGAVVLCCWKAGIEGTPLAEKALEVEAADLRPARKRPSQRLMF
jgi:hypothetical protein